MWKVAGVLFILTGGVCTAGVIAVVCSREGGGAFCVVMSIFAIIFFALGISMMKIKTRKLTPQEKEKLRRTLTCKYVGGLPLASGCICSVIFEENEIVISGGESTFRVPFQKIVSLKNDFKVNIERRYGYSISGAIIGGAALGPAGAGLLGVKQKKKRTVDQYLVIVYNPRENVVNTLVFLPFDDAKARRFVKDYLPLCQGQKADITL